jgi:hypothetical protein
LARIRWSPCSSFERIRWSTCSPFPSYFSPRLLDLQIPPRILLLMLALMISHLCSFIHRIPALIL